MVTECTWIKEELDETFFDGADVLKEYLFLHWLGLIWRECNIYAEVGDLIKDESVFLRQYPGSVYGEREVKGYNNGIHDLLVLV